MSIAPVTPNHHSFYIRFVPVSFVMKQHWKKTPFLITTREISKEAASLFYAVSGDANGGGGATFQPRHGIKAFFGKGEVHAKLTPT